MRLGQPQRRRIAGARDRALADEYALEADRRTVVRINQRVADVDDAVTRVDRPDFAANVHVIPRAGDEVTVANRHDVRQLLDLIVLQNVAFAQERSDCR